MTIPKFDELFNDVLRFLEDGQERHNKIVRTEVAESLDLTDEERNETLNSGRNKVRNRVHWAIEFLAQSGAVVRPRRGYLKISDLGLELLNHHPHRVTLADLKQTTGYKAWSERSAAGRERRKLAKSSEQSTFEELDDNGSPLESIDSAITLLNSALADELLQRIREERPEFLEKLVLKLLHEMGYGSSLDDLKHVGGSGDEGVDGVIHQDELGIDKIYVQVKRYKDANSIGRPQIQNFVGALSGKKATRGVFITSSRFTQDAREYAGGVTGFNVVLIDGDELASLMLQKRVGVTVQQTFDLLAIDENFFVEDSL